jgi:H+/Cl- antiporter ClcA
MSGKGVFHDTSRFNAEATRPALAESDTTPIATFDSPQSRPDPKHCDGSMVSDGGLPGRGVSRSQRYLTFAAAILVTGVLSGVVGGFTTVLVRTLEHLSFGYDQGPLLIGVRDASIERRLIGLAIGCALAGLGWWLLRRKTSVPGLNESIRQGRRFSQVPMAIDALLQVLAVGSGASLGREQAPRLFAAAATELTIRLGSIPAPYRRILLASAAGAGLAAVYNVPAAGALYACGIVLKSWRPVAVLVAVATSCIATVTAWPVSHGHPTLVWPDTQYSWTALLFTVALMPVAAAVGTGFNGLIRRAQPKSPPASWTLLVTIGLAGLLTGACSIWMPQMPGNGKSIIVESLAGGDTLIAVTVAMVLKPVLTALFIRAGAVGGMLTPSLATGVATGASIALLVERLGGYASVPTAALIGGAAVLGITQRAPVFAAVFTAELTHPPPQIWGMLLLAAVGAHWVRLLAGRRRRPAEPERAQPHFKHRQRRLGLIRSAKAIATRTLRLLRKPRTPSRRKLTGECRVDAVNTFRRIRRSFHVLSRRFA